MLNVVRGTCMFILDLDLAAQRVRDPTPESGELASRPYTSVKCYLWCLIFFSQVVGIIKRNWRPYCGVLSKSSKPQVKLSRYFCIYRNLILASIWKLFITWCFRVFAERNYLNKWKIVRLWIALPFTLVLNYQGTRHLFIAAERRIPRIMIETRQADTLEGQRIVVSIDSWPQHSKYPVVRLALFYVFSLS